MASFQQQYSTLWNQLFAAAVLAAVIPLALIFPMQRFYVQGLPGSGIKG